MTRKEGVADRPRREYHTARNLPAAAQLLLRTRPMGRRAAEALTCAVGIVSGMGFRCGCVSCRFASRTAAPGSLALSRCQAGARKRLMAPAVGLICCTVLPAPRHRSEGAQTATLLRGSGRTLAPGRGCGRRMFRFPSRLSAGTHGFQGGTA